MIPKVKTWRVQYTVIRNGRVICLSSCLVDTINKRFAKWLARDIMGYPATHFLRTGEVVSIKVGLISRG